VIHAFTHSNRGYWNLCHIPLLPVTGEVDPNDFGSSFDHKTESAEPGYDRVLLKRYNINAELNTTPHRLQRFQPSCASVVSMTAIWKCVIGQNGMTIFAMSVARGLR
jgi:putative alpha-1,2-mannosidase